jgi:hypothetical protein
VDDKDLMFLAEVLKVPVQELFPGAKALGVENVRFCTSTRERSG